MVRKGNFTRILSGLGAVVLLTGIAAQVLLPSNAFAAGAQQIEPRTLTLQTGTSDINADGIPDGGSMAGATVTHDFKFTVATVSNETLGSLSFQYCTTADQVAAGINCDAPAGLDVTGATLATDTGITGFTVKSTSKQCNNACATPNAATIGLSTAFTTTAPTALEIAFSGIVNPTTSNQTFFVRIYSYAGLTGGVYDPTDPSVLDYGNVAASTANPIRITGQMPESLVFCTGKTVGTTSGVPDCTTATSGNISFNQLFSPVSTAITTSQMAASTNATSGYAITVGGPTLTSGSNTITAMAAAANSTFGVSQFGLNLVTNDGTAYANAPKIDATTLPATYAPSANVTPVSGSAGGNYNGEAIGGFKTNGTFQFNAAALNTVADSGYNTSPDTPKGTDAQIYTVSYIANVPGSQPAGSYTTTLTYICTPTF